MVKMILLLILINRRFCWSRPPNAKEAWFQDSGHFPMMDEPHYFHETVRNFLNNG